jgi:hypothetical protein
MDQAQAAYGELFGSAAVSRKDSEIRIKLGGGELRLLAAGPDAPEGPERLDVAVKDLGLTAALLEKAAISHRRTEKRITVAAIEACGVELGFVPEA